MADTGAKKYLFDNDFSADSGTVPPASKAGAAPEPARGKKGGDDVGEKTASPDAAASTVAEPVEEAPLPPTYSEEDLARAREEGMQAGRDEATRDIASAMEQRLADTLSAISTQIATLFDTYTRDSEEHSRDAVGVAAAIVHKLFPALNTKTAMAEIEHMIIEAMKRTAGTPALIIRVPKELQEEVEARSKDLAALRGREGTLKVIADADMAIGDVTVEWGGGGMVRDTRFIWQEIDEIIERNLGQKLEAYAAPQSKTEQLVVKPAQVGKNEGIPVESRQTGDDTPETAEPQKPDAEPEN